MATANTALRVSELDFLTIKENLKNYLKSQTEFQDYNFEGSGMSVLLDILAYNTHYMGYYLNMVGNEMFLDTAQLRSSVISHAKNLNYFPLSAQGALAKANVVVTPSGTEDQNTNIITLDKYTKFLAQDIDGVNYNFVALHSNTAAKSGGSFTFNNIMFKQGEVVTRQYLMDPTNTTRRFEIPSANVDLTTLTITVQQSSTNTFTTEYMLADDITTISGNSSVYFIEENQSQNYTLYFGDNVIGKKPDNGNIITVTYLDTVGSVANNISRFYLSDAIGGLYRDNVAITVAGYSYGGTDKETVEQVRFRAPYFYTSQNRAVTTQDYQTLITKDYNNIDSVAVWGGEDNDPVIYGKVFLSLKTKENYYLTNLEKEQIKEDLILKRNVLTVIPEILDPEYVYIKISGQVTYNPNITNLTSNQILQYVKAAIADYNTNELNTFDSIFRKSKLQSYIENSEKSITGSDITVYFQKRQTLDLNVVRNYIFKYNLHIKNGDVDIKISSYPQISVRDATGVARDVFIEEVPQSFTGVDAINIIDPGMDYTSTPTVTITGDGTGATARAYVINRKIDRIEVLTPGVNYTRATVSITGGDGSGASAKVILQKETGTLRTYYYKTNGERVIVNEAAGTINYSQGTLTLNALTPLSVAANDLYDDNVLTIDVPPYQEIIYPLRNRILSIDENDASAIQIEMIAES